MNLSESVHYDLQGRAKEIHSNLMERAKNPDSALSAFDRNKQKGLYSIPLAEELRLLFQPIRQDRITARSHKDIGGVAKKRVFKKAKVAEYIAMAETILKECSRPDYVCLALLLCTGRRTAEICGASLLYSDHFIGTVKSWRVKTGKQVYLVNYYLIDRGLMYLESSLWRPVKPEFCNAHFAVPLMRALPKLFNGVKKVHELRKIYMAKLLTLHRFKNPEVTGRFISETLAHDNPLSSLPYLNLTIK